jgi:hypothetical protein
LERLYESDIEPAQSTEPWKEFDEGCATSYRLKLGPVPPNDVGDHTERQGGREKGGKGRALMISQIT